MLGLCAVWALTATGFALNFHREAERLAGDLDLQRAAHEDKVRALTRRLVGVASHGMLEQEGLAGRLADIITRQVDLETREAALAALAERASAGIIPVPVPAPSNPASPGPEEKARRGEATGTEPRDGTPARNGGASARPRSDLGRPEGGAGQGAIQGTANLPLREQFTRIEASLGRVEAGQIRIVAALAEGARTGLARIRTVLAELPLPLAPPPAQAPAGPGPADAFAREVARAGTAFDEAGRWRSLAEAVPLRAPIEAEGNRSSNFGMRKDPFTGAARMHAGMDFRSPVGTPVRAAAPGRVVAAGVSGGYGNLVEIDHGHGLVTRYGHLSSLGVSADQTVAAGATIGLVGSTGRSTGPHLHYETRASGTPLDPGRFLAAGHKLYGQPAPSPEPEPAEAVEAAD